MRLEGPPDPNFIIFDITKEEENNCVVCGVWCVVLIFIIRVI